MDKVFYEVDPFNRLIVRNTGSGKSKVKKFRKVVCGRFKADGNNELFYEVNQSSGLDIPQKIKFSGKYALDKSNNLIVTLNKWNNQCEGNRLALKARIMDAKSDEITLLINSKSSGNKYLTYMMKLCGSWQADKHNRLTFGVERDGENPDKLILSGAWEVNKNNEIVYRHSADSQAVTFRGYWDIADKCRLSYVLDKKIDSGFNFRPSIATLAPKGKDVYAVFDIGIALSRKEKPARKIIFSGRFKMGKGKELILESSDTDESGLSLKFSKEMFDKNGLAYIESIIKGKECFIGGGMVFKW
jgi:hypothetical protein